MRWPPSDREALEPASHWVKPTSMCEEPWIWQCDRVIPNRADEGRRVQEEILQKLQQQHWIEGDLFGVRLAMEEALVNAIKHGNARDPSKQIRIACQLFRNRLRIEITDQGRGFDPAQVPDPTKPERLDCPCGRGIMLMRSFMSRVEFNELGNQVAMEKTRTRKT